MRQTKLEDFLELEEHNKELEKRIKVELEKNRKKDELLFRQAKMASMGEMLANISHQWRQPLMEISSLFIPLEAKLKMNLPIDNKELQHSITQLNEITKYMSSTIDDFKNFFSKDKEKMKFEILQQINSTINIINGGLKSHNINLDIIIKKNPTILAYKNEYSQALINIINNAKDALVQRKIKNPKIDIIIEEKEGLVVTSIHDNAGGINVRPIEKVFDPFFTYEKTNGSGIGLFMSKLIIENNMNGKLEVENKKDGALFIISIPKL
ncbi:sensor histidine kinase [Arcobacter sp. YIC-464]|uniref:sensor histidine kinase n=1 Tax=Arcobacter sp. YIC-464 TaxID=3376631 RepID=UPI003C191E03